MFKDYDKYLSTSLKVYLFVLVIIFIMKMVGLDYFGLSVDSQFIIKLGNIVSYNVLVNNLVYLVPLIINQYVLLSLTLNDNSKRMKVYNLILLPIFYIFQVFKIKLFGNLSFIVETFYSIIVVLIYNKKIEIKVIKRFFKVLLFIFFVQLLSMFTRVGYSIEYISNPIINIILNLDYVIILLIVHKIKFMKGDEEKCYYQAVQCSSLQKQINLKKLLKKSQKNCHNFINNFKKQDKITKITNIIYFILSLIWNVFTIVTVIVMAMLNDTFIECIFILTSFWLSKGKFGKPFHLKSMTHCFIVSNLTYYVLNRVTTPLGISIIIPIMLGVGLSYVTSKLVKKTYKPLYRGMPEDLFEETILKVTDKDSDKYAICYDFYINKKSTISLAMKYNYSEAGIRKIKDRINNKIKEL